MIDPRVIFAGAGFVALGILFVVFAVSLRRRGKLSGLFQVLSFIMGLLAGTIAAACVTVLLWTHFVVDSGTVFEGFAAANGFTVALAIQAFSVACGSFLGFAFLWLARSKHFSWNR